MSYKVGENSYALEEAGEGGGDYQQQQYGDYEQQGQEQNDPQYSGYEQQGQELNDPQYSGYEQQDQQYGGYEQPPQQQYGNYDQQQQYGEYADDQQPPQHLEQEPSRESFIDRESFVDTSIVLLDDGRTQKSTMNSTYGNRAVSPGKAPINLGVDSKGDDEDIENKAVGGPFDKFNMEPPQGITKTVRRRMEVPKEVLDRILLEGEEVIGQYDYYFIKKRMHLSDVILYGIYTCGIYFIIRIVYKFWLFLRNIVYCFWWKENIESKRGKMIITSNGRVIFWESRIRQDKAMDSRAYFKLSYSTHIASIHDLRQMRISYEHKKQGFYWFCPRYEAAVQLTFYSFNHKDSSRSKFLRTFPVRTYMQALKSFIIGKVKTGPRDQLDPLVVGISTDLRDKQNTPYAYENSEQALDEMIIMCENMMKHFGSIRDAFLKSNAYVPMNRSNIHQVRINDENFKSGTPGVKDVCADLNGTSPLLDETDGNLVNVPLKWLMLAPGEELVAAIGQRYHLNCGEILLAILSFGIYYFIRLRIKSWQRSAIFITTKRVIEMTVNQHKGRIPVAFTGFRAVVRSYFPGDIDSGFIRGTGSRVISTLMTSSGTIVATLPRIHLPFAHHMHLTASRVEPNLQSFEGVRYRLPERFQFVRNEDLEGRGRGMLSDTDLALLPSLYEEEIISRFVGGIKYTPCCPANPVYYCERFWNPRWVDSKPQTYVCTYTSAFKKIAIYFSMIITCCFRPVKRRNDAIITTHTLYYVSSGPNPLEPFFLTWVAIKSVKGSSSTVKARGAHPFKNCTCCCVERRAIIAKGSSTYDIQVRTNLGFSLPFSFSIPFHNWLEDENYGKMIAVLGAADVRLIDDI